MRRFFVFHYFLIALLIPSFAQATDSYFSADTIPPTLLTSPNAVGSKAWKSEVAEILTMQSHADKKAIAAAETEMKLTPETLVLSVDPMLTRQDFPALYHLLDRVNSTSQGVKDIAKQYWNTKRPYLSDKRIKALIEPHDNPAYPSGHTTGSYTWAHILSLLMPDKRQALYARAEEIAMHRVLVGMHYPNDLEGGRQLALLIVGGLLQIEAFQGDFKAAQQELSKKLSNKKAE